MAVRKKLYEQVMDDLLAGILRGDYAATGRLPKEQDIAAEHGVSRNVARESIQALKDRDVLTVKHGVGTTIAPVEEWDPFDPTVMESVLATRERRRALVEATECRAIVWPAAAALAAERRTDADLAALEAALDRSDAEYLSVLLRTAGNRFVRQVASVLERTIADPAPASPSGGRRTLGAVHRAVIAGDVEASRAAMRQHVARGRGSSRKRS